MKKAILVLLLVAAGATTVQAQKLKDLLYGGKLRSDSNSVVRKSDDLSTKIDTAQKKTVAAPMAPTSVDAPGTAAAPAATAATTPVTAAVSQKDSTAAVDTAAIADTEPKEEAGPTPVKSNNRIWKEYTDSLVNTLKAEVLSNKKIKKETYYITVGYEVDTNGQVNITNVSTTPENALLQAQVKQRIEVTPPPLNPVLDGNNQPRKVKRNYNFSVTKD